MANDIAIQAQLDAWVTGEIIAERTSHYGERVVIAKDGGRYAVYRAFPLGQDDAGLSVDMADRDADEVIRHLLAA